MSLFVPRENKGFTDGMHRNPFVTVFGWIHTMTPTAELSAIVEYMRKLTRKTVWGQLITSIS